MKIVASIAKKFHIPTVEEREHAYLCASRDRYDLEFRQKEIDRGLFRSRSMNGIF